MGLGMRRYEHNGLGVLIDSVSIIPLAECTIPLLNELVSPPLIPLVRLLGIRRYKDSCEREEEKSDV
jgi:hypothetical protein